MAHQTTKPVASSESFEAYCRSLGINPLATRQATVTAALAGMLASLESTVDAAYAALASGSLKAKSSPTLE